MDDKAVQILVAYVEGRISAKEFSTSLETQNSMKESLDSALYKLLLSLDWDSSESMLYAQSLLVEELGKMGINVNTTPVYRYQLIKKKFFIATKLVASAALFCLTIGILTIVPLVGVGEAALFTLEAPGEVGNVRMVAFSIGVILFILLTGISFFPLTESSRASLAFQEEDFRCFTRNRIEGFINRCKNQLNERSLLYCFAFYYLAACVNILSYYFRSDRAADGYERVGFPLVVWQAGGISYSEVFFPFRVVANIGIVFVCSLAVLYGVNVSKEIRPMPIRKKSQ